MLMLTAHKARLLASLFAILALGNGISFASASNADNPCSIGSVCHLSGKLELFQNAQDAVGKLHSPDSCWLLALPKEIHLNSSRWADKEVSLSGEAYAYGYAPGVTSFLLKDRWVLTFAEGDCRDDLIIYVTEIEIRE